jgi:ABC-type sugar transport system permease subunit
MNKSEQSAGRRKMSPRTKSRLIFYSAMMALPLICNLLMYVAVNVNGIVKAFQIYEYGENGYEKSFAYLDNFRVAIQFLKDTDYMIVNSLIVWVVGLLVGMTLSLTFSFYIYKRYAMSAFFKVMLFIPSIVSGMVLSLLFKYFVTGVYTHFAEMITGGNVIGLLDRDPDTKFNTILIYHIWISFGTRVLMFSNGMSGIDDSIVEAAELDGVSRIQEFFYITLPMIYPTFVTFFVMSLTGIFTNGFHLFGMFGINAKEIGTLGYYLYIQTLSAKEVAPADYYSYGQISAVGLILTAIVIPLVLGMKKLMYKVGPSFD